tara:strand:+ start:289 stop:939 length:651 start_codon:yes stop_codon:yes gene_type:complete
MAFLNGWGRGTWGQLTWGQDSIPVTLTGLAATSALGAPGVNGKAVASVAGLNATLGAVSVTINADANATPAGLASTSALGTIASVTGKANITPASQVGTSALGTVTPQAEAKVSISNSLVATLGNVSVLIDAEATIIISSGLAGTSALGTATTKTVNVVRISTVQQAFGECPLTLTPNAQAKVTLTGLSATGELGHVFKWEDIDESQTPNWTDVAA